MQKGSVNGAVKLLTNNMQNAILPLNEETINILRLKHPDASHANEEALLSDVPENIHPIIFEKIDSEAVRKAALKTKGGSGPSWMDGMDGDEYLLEVPLVKVLLTYVNLLRQLFESYA